MRQAAVGFWVAIGVVCLSLAAMTAKAATAPEDAEIFIEEISQRAIAILSDRDRPLETREEEVRRILAAALAADAIGHFALGRHWRQATDEQRTEYLNLFGEWIVRNYARRLSAYSGESFAILRAAPAGKEDALVMTQITQAQGTPLAAAWRVRDTSQGMKILDVIVEGVSMALTQRDEFDSIVQKNGVDGLIEMLRLKVSQYTVRPA